jgi:chromosome partitioning protein
MKEALPGETRDNSLSEWRARRSGHNQPLTVPPSILAVANQKGGVGKTTTAVSVGAALAEMGRKVLLIDIDPQANATSGLGVDRSRVQTSIYDVIVMGRSLAEARLPTAVPGLDVVPSDIALAGSEIELVDLPRRERRLQYALEALDSDDDYVLIDSPPSLGLLAINAVVAADALLIPIQCEFYALEGLGLLMHTLTLLRRELNPTLGIAGIVMTLFDARLALAHQVVDEVRARFGDQLLTPLIPRNVRLSEAPSHGLPITLYDPTCRGAIAYRELSANLDARIHSGVAFAAANVPSPA